MRKVRTNEAGTIPVMLVIAGVLLGGLFLTVISLYGYINGVRNQLVEKESALNAQFPDNQNELATFEVSFYEQAGIANLKSEKMDKIISDAVKGRYEGRDGQPVERGQGGMLFSAMVEAYPDLRGQLDVYDKIVSFVASGREAYKAKQSKLLDMIRSYETYRETGLVRSIIVGRFGYPVLLARVGGETWHGQEALDKMRAIVTTEATEQAYKSGKMKALVPPKS